MDLFETLDNKLRNLLPEDGCVHYYGAIMSQHNADQYLHSLLNNIAWKHDEAIIFGNKITTKRKVAWYGDDNFSYTYSKTTKTALPWTVELLELKEIMRSKTTV